MKLRERKATKEKPIYKDSDDDKEQDIKSEYFPKKSEITKTQSSRKSTSGKKVRRIKRF